MNNELAQSLDEVLIMFKTLGYWIFMTHGIIQISNNQKNYIIVKNGNDYEVQTIHGTLISEKNLSSFKLKLINLL